MNKQTELTEKLTNNKLKRCDYLKYSLAIDIYLCMQISNAVVLDHVFR